MQPTSSRTERSPLRAVTNTANSPLTKNAGSTPVKKTFANARKAPLPRMSLPLPPSDSNDTGSEKQKKPRPSLNKRVSFGGNSISVFYKQAEFSPQENEPPVKAPRTVSRSSPLPPRSPSFIRPDSRLLPMEDGSVSDDKVPTPGAQNMTENTFSPDGDPSPPVNENPSPVAARRDSMGFNDRRSFGVFIDEDVTMGERDVITDDQDDMTVELPRFHSVAKVRRASNMSVLSDGDITQNLYDMLPRMLAEEEYLGGKSNTSDDANERTSCPNSSADGNPEESAVKAHGFAEEVGPDFENSNGSSDLALAELDKAISSQGGNDHSATDAPAATKEGTQIEPISSSPGVGEPNDSAACPSPTVPVRGRPVPPNCRKLFDNDANEDEDNTLHYHEKPGRSGDVPGSSQRKSLGVLSSVVPSTPLSATQSKLRSAMEERASASGKRNAASKLRELSTSAMRSSQHGVAGSEGEGTAEKSFNFRDFLHAVQLNFDRKAETRQRGQSLAPQNYSMDNFDRSSTKGEVLESLRKVTVFETFRHQIETLREKIAQDKHSLEALEQEIEATRPPLFSKMADLEAMPIHETTTYRVSMKRLRKLSTLKNKEEWVTGRQVWEKDLGEKLRAAIAALGQDNASVGDSAEEIRVSNSLFVEQTAGLGVGAAFTDVKPNNDSVQEDDIERTAFIQEMSKCRDIIGYLDSLKHEEADLTARRESVAPLKSSLLSACRKLRKNANASNEGSMRKMITEQEELNSIVSGISGVKLLRVNKNSISLRALDMMDIQFSLHDEKVINTSCKTVSLSGEVTRPLWQPYMDGAVSLVNWNGGVKNVKYMRDIPGALYHCTSALRQARLVYEDAAFFLDKNMGRIVAGGLKRTDEAPCLDLTVEASFYSLSLRSKFDVTVTVTTSLSSDSSAHLVQQAVVEKVHRYFGDKPEDEVLSRMLIESGRRDLGVYSLADGLAGVWRSLG